MQVDLIRAIDAAADEAPRSDDQSTSGDFPGVLESAFSPDGETGADDRGASADAAGTESGPAATDAGEPDREGEAASNDAERAAEEAETAAASGAPGAAAAGLAERARALTGVEALDESEGRTTDLDGRSAADGGAAGLAGTEAERAAGDLQSPEELDEATARELAAAIEAEGEAATDDAETGARSAVAQGGTQEGQGIASTPMAVDEDAAVASGPGVDDEGQTQSDRERAEADRSAYAAQAAAEAAREAQDADAGRVEDDRVAEAAANAGLDTVTRQQVEDQAAAVRAPEVASVDGAATVANPVAGMVSETTPAAPGTPAPVAASEAIAVQTEWLATRGGGSARLVLHPPELGELAIRVTLRAGAVDVVMVAQDAVAAGVAEEQSERLAQAFAGRDLRLDQFEVRRGDPDGLDLDSEGRFAQSESNDDREAHGDERGEGASRRGRGAGREGEPTPVPRIVTIAPEQGGVDLRV